MVPNISIMFEPFFNHTFDGVFYTHVSTISRVDSIILEELYFGRKNEKRLELLDYINSNRQDILYIYYFSKFDKTMQEEMDCFCKEENLLFYGKIDAGGLLDVFCNTHNNEEERYQIFFDNVFYFPVTQKYLNYGYFNFINHQIKPYPDSCLCGINSEYSLDDYDEMVKYITNFYKTPFFSKEEKGKISFDNDSKEIKKSIVSLKSAINILGDLCNREEKGIYKGILDSLDYEIENEKFFWMFYYLAQSIERLLKLLHIYEGHLYDKILYSHKIHLLAFDKLKLFPERSIESEFIEILDFFYNTNRYAELSNSTLKNYQFFDKVYRFIENNILEKFIIKDYFRNMYVIKYSPELEYELGKVFFSIYEPIFTKIIKSSPFPYTEELVPFELRKISGYSTIIDRFIVLFSLIFEKNYEKNKVYFNDIIDLIFEDSELAITLLIDSKGAFIGEEYSGLFWECTRENSSQEEENLKNIQTTQYSLISMAKEIE